MPWVLVNHVPLFEHDPDLKRYVCAAFAGRKPNSCWEPEANTAGVHLSQANALVDVPPGHSAVGHTARSGEEA